MGASQRFGINLCSQEVYWKAVTSPTDIGLQTRSFGPRLLRSFALRAVPGRQEIPKRARVLYRHSKISFPRRGAWCTSSSSLTKGFLRMSLAVSASRLRCGYGSGSSVIRGLNVQNVRYCFQASYSRCLSPSMCPSGHGFCHKIKDL